MGLQEWHEGSLTVDLEEKALSHWRSGFDIMGRAAVSGSDLQSANNKNVEVGGSQNVMASVKSLSPMEIPAWVSE